MKSEDMMVKAAAWIIGFALVAGAVLAGWWVLWLLWCFVLGSLWPDGPVNLVSPGYWPFAAMWVLIGFVGRRVFGRSKSKSK